MPEGATVDEASMTSFQEWARTNNLTQEAAQAGLDLAVTMQKAQAQAYVDSIRAQVQQWATQAEADGEFGGTPDKFAQSKAVARRALDQFGSPELKKMLMESGLGSHPEIIRAFYRAGQAISPDTFVPGPAGAPHKTDAEVFYGTPKPH